jgi:histidinol dehydrogenase
MGSILRASSRSFWAKLEAFCQEAGLPAAARESVGTILADIRTRGDAGVQACLRQHDRVKLKPSEFAISPEEMAAAAARLSRAERGAIREALRCVRSFSRQGLPRNWSGRNPQGAKVGERYFPLERVGLYIPNGLVSTVVMTAGLAKLAGVPEVVAFTPCDSQGQVGDGVLAALHLAGVVEAYRIGGVAAIGAMSFGTATIRPVVKIFGPGNSYVVEAKRQVFGQVAVDLLPGPSELMVIADRHARSEFVACDLLAQAEHGSGREKIYLVADSVETIQRIRAEIRRQLPALPRAAAIQQVLKNGFAEIVAETCEAAAAVANFVAPEHLELEVEESAIATLTRLVSTAGAVMIGAWSATALGDFTAGTSHELPTGRSGRSFSGLRVSDFMRRSSYVQYDQRSLKRAAPVVAAFAAMERLEGHGRSVKVRLEADQQASGR